LKPQSPILKFFVRPHFASVCLLACGLAFFISLGNWQLGRARVKEALYASFVQSNKISGVSLAAALAKWPEQSYVRAEISGKFIPGKTVLLDSQTANGRIGVQVFQAFQSDEGMAVLVALGFMPIPPDRSSFPNPSTPSAQQRLKGLLSAPPASGIKLAEIGAPPSTSSWLVTRIEPQTFGDYFGVLLPKPVLLLDASTVPEGTASATDVLKLPRVWRPNTFPPERHRGYAATWFGFALTSVIIFLILHRNRKPNRFESSNEQPN
jgi:surfeit locus 1 family protein